MKVRHLGKVGKCGSCHQSSGARMPLGEPDRIHYCMPSVKEESNSDEDSQCDGNS